MRNNIKQIGLPALIFLLPSPLLRPLLRLLGHKIGKKCRFGFSWIKAGKLEMDDYAKIGHFNFINVPILSIGQNAHIKKFNRINGNFNLIVREHCVINQFNKITNPPSGERRSFLLKENAIVGVAHTIDVTSDITIGKYSILAGSGSQLWTHSFYHSKKSTDRWRIQGCITLGNNVYVGSGSIICAGVTICDNCTLGAGTVVSKDLTQEGLYVNQALRYLPFDPDNAILKYKKIGDGIYEK